MINDLRTAVEAPVSRSHLGARSGDVAPWGAQLAVALTGMLFTTVAALAQLATPQESADKILLRDTVPEHHARLNTPTVPPRNRRSRRPQIYRRCQTGRLVPGRPTDGFSVAIILGPLGLQKGAFVFE